MLSSALGLQRLIDLHGRVDQPCEPEASAEADRPGEHEEGEGGEQHVPEVQDARHQLADLELREEVEPSIQEEVQRRGPRREVGPPPPVVVLTAELEVAEHDRDLSAGDDEDDKHQEEEAKNVVELVQPDGGEDEEELDENRAERQDATDQDGEEWVHVPGLLRDLSWDLVGFDWRLHGGFLEPKIAADKHEGH